MSRKVGVFHPGTQHSWQTARALDLYGDLAWYATSLYWMKGKFPYNLAGMLPDRLRRRAEKEFGRLFHPDLDVNKVRAVNNKQWLTRIAHRAGFYRLERRLGRSSDVSMGARVRRLMDEEPVRALWGYNNSALEAFEFARSQGIPTILDRTIGHPRVHNRIMGQVYEQYGEFFLSPNFLVPENVIRRADAEHELADAIVVGCEYCGDTLRAPEIRHSPAAKVRVLPYCYDDVFFTGAKVREAVPNRPVRFLFTGQATPRKGIHLVLKVFDRIPKTAASLTILGGLEVPKDVFARYADRVTFHNHVPRPDVRAFMQDADYLVFPSYFEGAGLNVIEALAMGLGLVQSRHAFVPFPHSPTVMNSVTEEELHRCVMEAIETRSDLPQTSALSIEKAKDYTFSQYANRVADVVRSACNSR